MPREKNTVGLPRRTRNGRRQFEIEPGRWVSAERVRQIKLEPTLCRKCRLSPKTKGEYCDLCAERMKRIARREASE